MCAVFFHNHNHSRILQITDHRSRISSRLPETKVSAQEKLENGRSNNRLLTTNSNEIEMHDKFSSKADSDDESRKKPIKNQPIEIDGKNSTQRRRQICGQVVQIY